MKSNTKVTVLSPRQIAYMRAYTEPISPSFGNSYQSAVYAGYSRQTAKNFMSLNRQWLSENIRQLAVIKPEELMQELAGIIQSNTEPTIIRLKAIELNMRAYSMFAQAKKPEPKSVTLSIDLTGN